MLHYPFTSANRMTKFATVPKRTFSNKLDPELLPLDKH